MDWNDIEETLKLLKEAEKNGEEIEIQCLCDNCDECPFGYYCK